MWAWLAALIRRLTSRGRQLEAPPPEKSGEWIAAYYRRRRR